MSLGRMRSRPNTATPVRLFRTAKATTFASDDIGCGSYVAASSPIFYRKKAPGVERLVLHKSTHSIDVDALESVRDSIRS